VYRSRLDDPAELSAMAAMAESRAIRDRARHLCERTGGR
jgi:hypothetical protein